MMNDRAFRVRPPDGDAGLGRHGPREPQSVRQEDAYG